MPLERYRGDALDHVRPRPHSTQRKLCGKDIREQMCGSFQSDSDDSSKNEVDRLARQIIYLTYR